MNYSIQIIEQGTGRRSSPMVGDPSQHLKVFNTALDQGAVNPQDRVLVLHTYEDIPEEAEYSTLPVVTVETFLTLMKKEISNV